jgi:hypothetical protein
MDAVAFELARALTADLAGMYNPGNYEGSKFSARTWGGTGGLSAARAVSGMFRAGHHIGRRAPVNRVLFASRSSRPRSTGYSGYKRRRVGKRSYQSGRLPGRYRRTQGRLNKELKNFDNINNLALSGASSQIQLPSSLNSGALLVGLAQGTTANTRTGRKILVKKVQVVANVTFAGGATSSDVFKWWLVLDKQANGAYPTSVSDIWAAEFVGEELRNLDTSSRYKIMAAGQMEFASGAGVAGAYDSQVKMLNIELPCNLLVEMSSTAGAITEIKNNNILLCSGSLNDACTVSGSSRIRFYDQG